MPENSFLNEIDKFVDEYINKHKIPSIGDNGKVIHDALWGTQYIYPHELAILDTPLIQRLRRIKQTAFSYLIYPSSIHTRFEHTIGVIFQSNRLFSALNENYSDLIKGKKDMIRMAALLHDCGHGPFSHSSEEIYKFFPDMQKIIGPGGDHEGCNPHEVLSYYIIKSDPFRTYFNKVINRYNKDINLDQIAKMILGAWDDPQNKYIADIINGPFDADKIDYIYRDGLFSGLPLKIDLDRLWYTIQIKKVSHEGHDIRMLVMSINGVTPLEQILFSKMVLFTSLYQHHKVRTCDCMLKAIIEYCKNKNIKICGRKMEKATDFLWITDDKLYAEADRRKKDDPLHKLIHDLKFRRLFKRALILSKATAEEPSRDFFGYSALKELCTDLYNKDPNLRNLAKRIWQKANKPCRLNEVWIDLPKLPPIGSADDIYVNKGTHKNPNFVKLKDIFRVDDWAQDYTEHNWRGHVFCIDDIKVREKISDAAISILEEEFNVKFNMAAKELCKIDSGY